MEMVSGFSSRVSSATRRLAPKATFVYCANLDSVYRISLLEALGLSNVLPGIYDTVRSGSGREVIIGRRAFDDTRKLLGKGVLRVGGQAGNMALDAAGLGVTGYMHTPSYSKRLLSLFKPSRILVASGKGFSPASECSDSSEAPIHLILEYEKGEGIPSSNRFIASFDELNSELMIHPLFSRNILAEMPDINRAFIAGFHLASEDAYRLREYDIKTQLQDWKHINPDLRIHLEWGDFASKWVGRAVAKDIFPEIDCVGFNENELPGILRASGENEKGIDGIAGIVERVGTALFHTRDYSMAFSKEFSERGLADSLGFATCAAAMKASTGNPPTLEGMLNGRFRGKRVKPPKMSRALFQESRIAVAFCPSAQVKPKITVGLGDCFSMAFFLSLG